MRCRIIFLNIQEEVRVCMVIPLGFYEKPTNWLCMRTTAKITLRRGRKNLRQGFKVLWNRWRRKIKNELCKKTPLPPNQVRSYEAIPISFLAMKSKRKNVRSSINILNPNKLKKLNELVDMITRRHTWVTLEKRTPNHGKIGDEIKIWLIHDEGR